MIFKRTDIQHNCNYQLPKRRKRLCGPEVFVELSKLSILLKTNSLLFRFNVFVVGQFHLVTYPSFSLVFHP